MVETSGCNLEVLFGVVAKVVPDGEEGHGGEGRGVRAGDGPDEEGESKIPSSIPTQKDESQKHKDNGEGVVQRPNHGFRDGLIGHFIH